VPRRSYPLREQAADVGGNALRPVSDSFELGRGLAGRVGDRTLLGRGRTLMGVDVFETRDGLVQAVSAASIVPAFATNGMRLTNGTR
jgi:hypothetical protein